MSQSTSARLFVLGDLARKGPQHGYGIRRDAEIDRIDAWTGVRASSVHNALRQMEREGFVEAVRVERSSRYPERTIYGITPAGIEMLHRLRQSAWFDVRIPADPFDLALGFSDDAPTSAMRDAIENRIRELVRLQDMWRSRFAEASPHLSAREKTIFRHYELRIEAELTWHGELLEELPELMGEHPDRVAPPATATIRDED